MCSSQQVIIEYEVPCGTFLKPFRIYFLVILSPQVISDLSRSSEHILKFDLLYLSADLFVFTFYSILWLSHWILGSVIIDFPHHHFVNLILYL